MLSRISQANNFINFLHICNKRKLAYIAIAICITTSFSLLSFAQNSPVKSDTREFFHSITGSWIGTCEQSTDGQKADNKYFSATISELSSDKYSTKFEYYRMDNNKPLHIGDATVLTTINADGSASSRITGKGTVLVNKQPKPQEHDFTEKQVSATPGTLQGTGTGTIKVSNMPLGFGKNGKVKDSRSQWSLKNGNLVIDQTLNVKFSALIFSKSFNVAAKYTAKRGTDLASLMSRQAQVSQAN